LSFWGFAAAADGPWIACTSPSTTRVYVYDVRDGSMAASVETGIMPSVAWVPRSGEQPALLVVGSTQGIQAFRIREKDAAKADAAGR